MSSSVLTLVQLLWEPLSISLSLSLSLSFSPFPSLINEELLLQVLFAKLLIIGPPSEELPGALRFGQHTRLCLESCHLA